MPATKLGDASAAGMARSCRMSFKRKLERSQKVNGFLSDLRFAVKQLVAKPGFDVAPYEPMTLAGTIVVLLVVTFLACYIPARRASKLNPAEVILDQ